MTDRFTASTITDDQLDALYAERDRLIAQLNGLREVARSDEIKARHDALRLLAGRAQRLGLNWEEGDLLREHLDAEIQDGDNARATIARARKLIEMQKQLIGTERRIVMTAMSHREDEGARIEHCDHCGRDHMAELDEAIQAADIAYVKAFPAGANAEDCPRCTNPNPPYPFLCPGHPVDAPHHGGPIGWQDPNA